MSKIHTNYWLLVCKFTPKHCIHDDNVIEHIAQVHVNTLSLVTDINLSWKLDSILEQPDCQKGKIWLCQAGISDFVPKIVLCMICLLKSAMTLTHLLHWSLSFLYPLVGRTPLEKRNLHLYQLSIVDKHQLLFWHTILLMLVLLRVSRMCSYHCWRMLMAHALQLL